MNVNLDNLYIKHDADSRSISAENPSGEKGKGAMANSDGAGPARELGQGWKIKPCIAIKAGKTITLMDNDGPGIIRHMWFTFSEIFYRDIIIRIFWDGSEYPSVEVPLADFLCNSWNKRLNILALPINVNPTGGMNIYFPMPFQKQAKITVQNDSPNGLNDFFYTINFTLENVENALYFHANWYRIFRFRMI